MKSSTTACKTKAPSRPPYHALNKDQGRSETLLISIFFIVFQICFAKVLLAGTENPLFPTGFVGNHRVERAQVLRKQQAKFWIPQRAATNLEQGKKAHDDIHDLMFLFMKAKQ